MRFKPSKGQSNPVSSIYCTSFYNPQVGIFNRQVLSEISSGWADFFHTSGPQSGVSKHSWPNRISGSCGHKILVLRIRAFLNYDNVFWQANFSHQWCEFLIITVIIVKKSHASEVCRWKNHPGASLNHFCHRIKPAHTSSIHPHTCRPCCTYLYWRKWGLGDALFPASAGKYIAKKIKDSPTPSCKSCSSGRNIHQPILQISLLPPAPPLLYLQLWWGSGGLFVL